LIVAEYGPSLPSEFIIKVPHPNAAPSYTTLIPIGTSLQPQAVSQSESGRANQHGYSRTGAPPYFPFRSRADFIYAKTAVEGSIPSSVVDDQLAAMHGDFTEGRSNITFRSSSDMERSLQDARRSYGVQVFPLQNKPYVALIGCNPCAV
jgi:hypothetical protein